MRHLPVALCLATLALGCGSKSPTEPGTPPVTETRVIQITGSLAFGTVDVNTVHDRVVAIHNLGTHPLSITGITGPSGPFAASPTSFTVPSPGIQNVTIRFSPTEARTYSGNVSFNGNQTSGANTIALSANVLGPLFSRGGTGNTVFDMPAYVNRVKVVANTPSSCQNFIVRRNGVSFINVILGTCAVADVRTYEGIHLVTGGGVIEIVSSEGVNWAFGEER